MSFDIHLSTKSDTDSWVDITAKNIFSVFVQLLVYEPCLENPQVIQEGKLC